MSDANGDKVPPGHRECQGCGTVWDDREPGPVAEHHYPWCPLSPASSGSSEAKP